MKRRSSAVLALLAVGALVTGVKAGETLEQIRKRGALVAGVKYRVPPFGFVDDATGELVGYDVDVVRAIAGKLGVKLELRPVDQKTRIPELVDGHVDLVAANFARNPNTGRIVAFSDTYLITGVGFLAKRGAVSSLKDLAGKRIAVGAGTSGEQAVQESVPGATTVPFESPGRGIQALRQGSVDAAAGDASILPALIRLLPAGEYEIPPIQIAEIPYVLGVRQGDKEFLGFLNRSLAEMEQTGDAKRIFERWFQPKASAGDGSATLAAGAVVRKSATRPGVVVVILKGTFTRGAEVSLFTNGGDFVCTGRVTNVFEDQIYVDTDPAQCDAVRPGYAVGMGVRDDLIKNAILKHQDVLKAVQEASKKEQEAYVTQREQEGIEKEKRDEHADHEAYESKLRVEEERAVNEDYYNRDYIRR